MSEQWRTSPRSPYYEVSDQGRVRTVTRLVGCVHGGVRTAKGKLLKPSFDKNGYLRVNLHSDNSYKTCYVQVLVLEAFVGLRPPGLEACHWDGDPTNNALSNLRWDTYEANREDMRRHGRGPKKKSHCDLGHEKSGPNAMAQPSRRGVLCRACQRARSYLRDHPPAGDRNEAFRALSDRQYAELMAQAA